jgi:tetratricopeptide (TPR) repeat protein
MPRNRRNTLSDRSPQAAPGAASTDPACGTAPQAELDALRHAARDAYEKGRLAEAEQAQSAVLAATQAYGLQTAADVLFAGLILHAARRGGEAVSLLRDALKRFPGNAELPENLAVLLLSANDAAGAIEAAQAALVLGSESPNVHDCLCDAYRRIGRTDLAVEAGRLALQAKDHRFGAAAPLVAMPATLPPAFNPGRPEQNVIAYTLWGNQPRYHVPLLENTRIRPHLFPEWTLRVYHDQSVDQAVLARLTAGGVQLRPMALPADVPRYHALLWRFAVVADPGVQRFLIRDADSLLTVKERVAVDAWLRSEFHFHAMRDWYSHTDLLLAGMWGGVGGILPAPAELLRAYTPWRVENDHLDQDLLSAVVWPAIRGNVLIHDSIFQPCLGSVAFPPFGALPSGHHIGQNAFLHFSKAG